MSARFDANDDVEIYESRVRLAFFLAMGILASLGSLFMTGVCIGLLLGLLGPPPTTGGKFVSPILAALIGAAGIFMFGSITIQVAGRLFGSRHPVLFLTREGFKDIRISSEWIPWNAIQSVKDYRGKGLVLDVDSEFVEKLRLGLVTRFMRKANRFFGYGGLWIPAFPLENMSARALLELMRERIESGGLPMV